MAGYLSEHGAARRASLYRGAGALSRHAYRLKYDSQRECPLYRSMRRRDKALAKLKGRDPMVLPRPKGMHASTYEKLVGDIGQEEMLMEALAKARFGIEI